jgi:predicted ferric reductase
VALVTLVGSTIGPSAYWYLTRASGVICLLLLTAAVALGVLDVLRFASARWPRFVIDGIHQTVSLLAVVFLVIHIITTVLDSFAPIGLVDAVLPFNGTYRPLWLGLGALSSDLLVAILITSLVRTSLGYRVWRSIHLLAYGCWPVALVHSLGTGSDTKQVWLLALYALCVVAVGWAVVTRLFGEHVPRPLRAAGVAATVAFAGGMLAWLPGGPLGSGWARRSGTPPSLLAKPVTSPRGHA